LIQVSTKRSRDSDGDSSATAKGISELVELRKQSLGCTVNKTFKYESMLANLDRMLSKLPEHVVEDLNMQFTTLAYSEFKKLEQQKYNISSILFQL